MQRNILIYGGALVATLAVLIFLASPDSATPISASPQSAPAGNSGVLVADTDNYDFGTVSMAEGNVSYDYVVRNIGTEPITVTKLYTSCMCTTATINSSGKKAGPFGMQGHGFIPGIKQVIDPGAEAVVTATFDPNAHGPAGVGRIVRVIYLEHDAGETVELNFEATVTP